MYPEYKLYKEIVTNLFTDVRFTDVRLTNWSSSSLGNSTLSVLYYERNKCLLQKHSIESLKMTTRPESKTYLFEASHKQAPRNHVPMCSKGKSY